MVQKSSYLFRMILKPIVNSGIRYCTKLKRIAWFLNHQQFATQTTNSFWCVFMAHCNLLCSRSRKTDQASSKSKLTAGYIPRWSQEILVFGRESGNPSFTRSGTSWNPYENLLLEKIMDRPWCVGRFTSITISLSKSLLPLECLFASC